MVHAQAFWDTLIERNGVHHTARKTDMFGYKGRDDVRADETVERVSFGLVLALVFTIGVLAGLSF
jgi:hypothetical protein